MTTGFDIVPVPPSECLRLVGFPDGLIGLGVLVSVEPRCLGMRANWREATHSIEFQSCADPSMEVPFLGFYADDDAALFEQVRETAAKMLVTAGGDAADAQRFGLKICRLESPYAKGQGYFSLSLWSVPT